MTQEKSKLVSSTMLHSPLSVYRAKIKANELRPDPSQALAVEKLQNLHFALGHIERGSALKACRSNV